MNLYCVRHGETLHNAAGRIQGQTDSQLSPLGIRQCQAVAEVLRQLPIDVVISSPLRRALDSARAIAEPLGLEVRTDARLMEINAGVFQGLCWEEIDERFPAAAARWWSHDPDFRIPEGESRRDVMHRAGEAFQSIREGGYRHAVVVAHGGSLAAALKALLEIPAARNPFSLGNASISTLVWEKEVKLMGLNEMSHLHDLMSGGGDL